MKKVVVLLAAYNGEKWIKEQIDSILSQKQVVVTLYISLDLSTDKTLEIINSYSKHNVILLSYGEKYGAAAPNFYRLIKDVNFSEYEYVALADQDDIWLEDKLISAIEQIDKEKSVAYSSNVTAFWNDGTKKTIIKATPQRKYDYLFESPGPGCTFVMTKDFAFEFQNYIKDKTEVLKKLDWHDWVIYAFARSRKYKWFIDRESHMLYRQHSNNQLGANSGIKQFQNRVRDILSGYGIRQTIHTISFLKMEKNEFVSKWLNKNRRGYFYLSLNSKNCRRRKKDQILFWFSCIIMMIKNIKMETEK